MVAKRGSVMLAIKNNAQIIAISAEASSYWTIPFGIKQLFQNRLAQYM